MWETKACSKAPSERTQTEIYHATESSTPRKISTWLPPVARRTKTTKITRPGKTSEQEQAQQKIKRDLWLARESRSDRAEPVMPKTTRAKIQGGRLAAPKKNLTGNESYSTNIQPKKKKITRKPKRAAASSEHERRSACMSSHG
jgi:hypothetical protein